MGSMFINTMKLRPPHVPACMCGSAGVCVCVCVCEREREREPGGSAQHWGGQ
jgi:hypothetical protein